VIANRIVNGSDGRTRLYLNDGKGRFTDATSKLPVLNDDSFAAALADVDGDRDIDIVIGNGPSSGARNNLLLNDGSGAFKEAPASQFATHGDTTYAVHFTDVDGDGSPDLVEANHHGPHRVRRNNGKGVFADVPNALGYEPDSVPQSITSGDVDGDGDVDLYISNISDGVLEINRGKGLFDDRTSAWLDVGQNNPVAATLVDLDGDKDLDLLLGGDETRLYWNDEKRRFVNANETLGVTIVATLLRIAGADVDGDGDPDLIVPHLRPPHALLLGDGTGRFVDRSATAMPKTGYGAVQVRAVDVDGDKDLDLVLGDAKKTLYLNRGDGTFVDATATLMPTSVTGTTVAILAGDFDRDGDEDLLWGGHVVGLSARQQRSRQVQRAHQRPRRRRERDPIPRRGRRRP